MKEKMLKRDRKPAVAGMFYEDDASLLHGHLKELFSRAKPRDTNDEVAAIIVPHAGYVYSGKIAASGFNQIPEDAKIERIFLIGSSHRVAFDGAAVYMQGDFMTPFGPVEVDADVAGELVEQESGIFSDPEVHAREHSLEVQVPFLQFHLKHPFKLVPLLVGPHDASVTPRIAKTLEKWFTSGNLFVISTDFSHYPSYEMALQVDANTAEAVLKNDPDELLSVLERNRKLNVEGLSTSMCGWSSVLTLLNITRHVGGIRWEEVDFGNSGDVSVGDKERVVGYRAMAVYRLPKTKKEIAGFSLNNEEKQWLLDRAHQTLKMALTGQTMQDPGKLSSENLTIGTGAFVSLYKCGELRGCIGSFGDDVPLWRVIDRMTAAAALNDSRFESVTEDELNEVDIEISVLTPRVKVACVDEIVPGKHGILIEKNGRSGTFLPQVAIKTGWNLEELLGHCARDKAGLGWDGWKDANIFAFEALVFGDKTV
ncbi:AmmeMemoRadiSam system protein B [Marinilabilia salmonicolor]|uniref:AmmeMemoRadiSam system protein B n=1 Tax=Marinilabilia salmonicolor TaxID=989 RepID=UPI00029A46E1|nr:AmmeMemoRadiSam system protein B [Marinilabilia salmonicolor]